jgi:hypothetical protein
MVNDFKEATNKSSNTDRNSNKKRKANDHFAFDEDIFDEIKHTAEDTSDDESIIKVNN